MTENQEMLKDFVVTLLEDKKAEDIAVIDISGKTTFAKYMIFASGRSVKNISSMADAISLELKHKTNLKVTIEGADNSSWVLVDIGDIMVHLFHPEARQHYQLEKLWS